MTSKVIERIRQRQAQEVDRAAKRSEQQRRENVHLSTGDVAAIWVLAVAFLATPILTIYWTYA